METLLEWGNTLHDEITCCVVLCQKLGIFTIQFSCKEILITYISCGRIAPTIVEMMPV